LEAAGGRLRKGKSGMVVLDLLVVLLVALPLAAIFAAVFRRHPIGLVLWFFVLLFLATWAAGVWLTRFGPVLRGVFWLPFLVAGLFFALLLASLIPPAPPPRPRAEAVPRERAARGVFAMFNILFWILVLFLAGAIVARYL
jgi:hypothetical protein